MNNRPTTHNIVPVRGRRAKPAFAQDLDRPCPACKLPRAECVCAPHGLTPLSDADYPAPPAPPSAPTPPQGPGRPRAFTDEEFVAAWKKYDGYVRLVALELGVTQPPVYKWARRLGLFTTPATHLEIHPTPSYENPTNDPDLPSTPSYVPAPHIQSQLPSLRHTHPSRHMRRILDREGVLRGYAEDLLSCRELAEREEITAQSIRNCIMSFARPDRWNPTADYPNNPLILPPPLRIEEFRIAYRLAQEPELFDDTAELSFQARVGEWITRKYIARIAQAMQMPQQPDVR